MNTTFRRAEAGKDYMLEVTMANNNRLIVDMKPYLNTGQFRILKNKSIWKNIHVQDSCLYWEGRDHVELPFCGLLEMFKDGGEFGISASIQEAFTDDWQLYLKLTNGSSLSMDIEPLLEFSVFAPLVQSKLWKTLQTKEHSLIWEDESIRLELPLCTILNYFAQ